MAGADAPATCPGYLKPLSCQASGFLVEIDSVPTPSDPSLPLSGDCGVVTHDRPSRNTSPAHVQAVAVLYGLRPPPLETARVLELGCGRGHNLQAFALSHPKAQVVGVGLWSDELEAARDEAQALGVQNLIFRQVSFTDIDRSLGLFDYIIARDEYTWAPDAVRRAIFRLCAQNLAPRGVAALGYHTCPGWHAGDTLRDAIQLHAHSVTSLADIQERATAALLMMDGGLALRAADYDEIRQAARRMIRRPQYYVNADFLQRANTGSYLLDVVGAAQAENLAYVGDCAPYEEQASYYGHSVQLQNGLMSMGQAGPVRQQYLDFAVNRKSRLSLFTQAGEMTTAGPGPIWQNLARLYFACSLKRKVSPTVDTGKRVPFIAPSGQVLELEDPLQIALCDTLSLVWPQSLHFASLLKATGPQLLPAKTQPEQHEAVLQALEALLPIDHIHYRAEPGPYDTDDSPDIIQLLDFVGHADGAERDIQRQHVHLDLWGDFQNITLGRSPAAMNEILEKLASGETDLLLGHPELIDFIEHLKWHGLLRGSSRAWVQYYATVLSVGDDRNITPKLHLLPSYIAHYCKIHDEVPGIKPGSLLRKISKQPPTTRMQAISKLRAQGAYEQMAKETTRLIADFPDHYWAWNAKALLETAIGNRQEAVVADLHALTLCVADPRLISGLVLNLSNQISASYKTQLIGLSIWMDQNCVDGYVLLGNLYRERGSKPASLACYATALGINPNDLAAQKNLGVLNTDLGNIETAVDLLKKCIQKSPNDFQAHSNYLFALSLYEGITPEALFEEHQRFGQLAQKAAKKTRLALTHTNLKDPEKRLRLGFVSGDLRRHAVAAFIAPFWKWLDKGRYEIYAYHTNPDEDSTTESLKALVDQWADVSSKGTTALAGLINSDRIDILFDLSGHTAYNRLPMFAYKPAPVQISWIGYPGTTGLTAVDYCIVNQYMVPADPREASAIYTEKLIKLPTMTSFECAYTDLQVGRPPVEENGYFTFGSFNRLNKITGGMYRAWAKILRAVPNSRLLIGHVESDSYRPLVDTFENLGIREDRLILQPRTSLRGYLELHHKVDLLLDTFPYNGGTTTYYGLWMGVPTLTLAGRTTASRVGAAILGPIGLGQFIAETEQEYIEKAVRFAAEPNELAALRQTGRGMISGDSELRAQMMTSSLDRAFRTVWQRWCDGTKATDLTMGDPAAVQTGVETAVRQLRQIH